MGEPDRGRKDLLLRLAALRTEVAEIEKRLGVQPKRSDTGLPPTAESALASLISTESSDLLSVLTNDGKYVYASPSAIDFLGLSPSEIEGRSATEFLHPEDAALAARSMTPFDRSNRKARYRLLSKGKDGGPRWVETRFRVTSDGEYIVCVTRDVDEEMREQLDQKARAEYFRKEAYTDFLTRLPNRRSLQETIDREVSRASRKGYSFSIALFDVDNFKPINDRLGHNEGDRVLQRVAFVLASGQRKYDTLGRWGGDEFLLLLPETSIEQAIVTAERYRIRVDKAQIRCGNDTITISGGVACSNVHKGIEEIVAAADAALYASKQRGRNRVTTRER